MGGDISAGGDASATLRDAPAETAAPSSDAGSRISVGLLLGYGIGLDLKGRPNPWGLGFGARGGYNLDQIYLGARFVFYLGGSKDIINGAACQLRRSTSGSSASKAATTLRPATR